MVVKHFVLKFNDTIILFLHLATLLFDVSSGDIIDANIRKLFNFMKSGATLCMLTEAQYHLVSKAWKAVVISIQSFCGL